MAEREIVLRLTVEEEAALAALLAWAGMNIRTSYSENNVTGILWSQARIDAIGRINAALNAGR